MAQILVACNAILTFKLLLIFTDVNVRKVIIINGHLSQRLQISDKIFVFDNVKGTDPDFIYGFEGNKREKLQGNDLIGCFDNLIKFLQMSICLR